MHCFACFGVLYYPYSNNNSPERQPMTTLEQITDPQMVDFDEEGAALYKAMREAEMAAVVSMQETYGATIYIIQDAAVLPVEAQDVSAQRRRKLVVLPDLNAHAAWPGIVSSLEQSRLEFKAWIDAAKPLDMPGDPGSRSTALPIWIGYDQDKTNTWLADRVRYSSTPAYRAGVLEKNEIIGLVEEKLAVLAGYLTNAIAARQHERADTLKRRRAALTEDLKRLKDIPHDVLARYLSGIGVKFTAKSKDHVATFSVPHFTVIAAKTLEKAPSRNRKKKYGEPVMFIEECHLEIYDFDKIKDAVMQGKVKVDSYKAKTLMDAFDL